MSTARQAALDRLKELESHFQAAMQIASPQERSHACEAIIKEADEICEAFAELKGVRDSWTGGRGKIPSTPPDTK